MPSRSRCATPRADDILQPEAACSTVIRTVATNGACPEPMADDLSAKREYELETLTEKSDGPFMTGAAREGHHQSRKTLSLCQRNRLGSGLRCEPGGTVTCASWNG